jgi:hypothetical protein
LGGLASLLIFVGALPALLALTYIAGLVLRRSGDPAEALAVSAVLTALPILGLWGLLGRGRYAFALGLWVWPLVMLWGSPLLFPGERGPALAEGLAWLAAPFGQSAAASSGAAGAQLGRLLGADPPWTPPQQVTPTPLAAAPPAPNDLPRLPPVGGVLLPFEGGGDSLRVRTTFDGPEYSEELALLFDTGATLTTLDRGALRSLGVSVPSDAPTAHFQTANGEVESPLVLLDRIWLSRSQSVEGVTVAVCDNCTRGETAGLLGLNVTGLFLTTVDHELQTITLKPRAGRPDRRLDLLHWMDIKATATSWPSGRVEVDLALTNRSTRLAAEAVVEIACPESSFSVTFTAIASGATKKTQVELPRGSGCPSYRVSLHSGTW